MVKNISLDEINIKLKTKEELKEIILDINEKQHINIGHLAILEIYFMHIELEKYYDENKEIANKHDKDSKDISRLIKRVQNKDLDINLIINSDEMPDELGKGYFKSLRNTSQQILSSISGYITEISYINEIAKDIIHREQIKNEYTEVVKDIDINKFYENVYNFLTEDMNMLMTKAMEIVSVLPLKMPRKKYYDMLKQSIIKGLKNSSKEEVTLLLDRYKTIFNGSMEEDYGQKFDYYFRRTHELKNFNFKDSSIEEITQIHNNTKELLDEINILVGIVKQAGFITNRYIVINMVKNKLSDLDNEIEEIIDTWKKYMSNDSKSKENVVNKIEEKIKEVETTFNESNLNLNKLITEFSNQEIKLDKDSNEELLKTQRVLAYLNDNTLEKEELLHNKEVETVNKDYLEQATDNFIEFINRNSKNMENFERKARMRRLLCLIDFPFKRPDDFFNYLRNSVENTSKKDLIVNINLVAEVIARYRVGNQ